MKKIILSLVILATAIVTQAQLNPVTWSFTATKISDKTYEVHMKATIQTGWHLYSQTQPDDAIAIPTSFKFNSNPLVKLNGKIKEVGKMEKFSDEKLGLSAHQYSLTVDFVQLVKLKVSTKTALTGSVEYQTCDDKKCLPPKTVTFTASIQ